MSSMPSLRSLIILCVMLGVVSALAAAPRPVPALGAPADAPGVFLPVVNTPPPPPQVITYAKLVDLLGNPVVDTITGISPGGNDRLYIATQSGRVWIVDQNSDLVGTSVPRPLLELAPDQLSTGFEAGLIGLAMHPNFTANRTFFITHTDASSAIVLARYQVKASNPDQADPASRVELLRIPKPGEIHPECGSLVHNAGDLHFGPDGYLYMATGDGGPDPTAVPDRPADICNNSQALNRLLGKILRLDVDQRPGNSPDCSNVGGAAYTIPPGNPLADGPGGACDEIWSYGLRNPWRFGIDRLTGDLYIADVGEERYEELNLQPAGVGGLNFGWRCYEGDSRHTLECESKSLTLPFFQYNHDFGDSSVIGGFVYRGSAYPSLAGYYVYTDFSGRDIRGIPFDDLDVAPRELVSAFPGMPQWTTFGQDADGELYLGGFLNNSIFKLIVPDS